MNQLYFGDNLDILREHGGDESVDLIYLDPPFNSQATYNMLFEEKNGTDSAAQFTAFDDAWHWVREDPGEEIMSTEAAYEEVVTGGGRIGTLLDALRQFLGTSNMMAYLVMMAIRLIELHRVLKPTGSIYLHCDPSASHYLKLLMDAVFSAKNFQNEIIWRYYQGGKSQHRFGRKHDTLLFYAKSKQWKFDGDPVRVPYAKSTIERYKTPLQDGKVHRLNPLGQIPSDVWTDIHSISRSANERLGYPTQKPEALLERIIQASSNEGDLVLDPFCGCGTTVAVAERLHRRWIGIDITHLAVGLMRHRLHDAFGPDLSPYEVIGDPQDLQGAHALAEENRYQFEWWALGKVEARPAQDKKKGADQGIDGERAFLDDDTGKRKRVIIQVKSGHVTASQIRDLIGVLDQKKAEIGAFITLQEPSRPMREAAAATGFYRPPNLQLAVPRLQILTIEELLGGKKLELPISRDETFRKAPRQFKGKRQSREMRVEGED